MPGLVVLAILAFLVPHAESDREGRHAKHLQSESATRMMIAVDSLASMDKYNDDADFTDFEVNQVKQDGKRYHDLRIKDNRAKQEYKRHDSGYLRTEEIPEGQPQSSFLEGDDAGIEVGRATQDDKRPAHNHSRHSSDPSTEEISKEQPESSFMETGGARCCMPFWENYMRWVCDSSAHGIDRMVGYVKEYKPLETPQNIMKGVAVLKEGIDNDKKMKKQLRERMNDFLDKVQMLSSKVPFFFDLVMGLELVEIPQAKAKEAQEAGKCGDCEGAKSISREMDVVNQLLFVRNLWDPEGAKLFTAEDNVVGKRVMQATTKLMEVRKAAAEGKKAQDLDDDSRGVIAIDELVTQFAEQLSQGLSKCRIGK
eukprot:gnl/MRDRNA2_/MRDRNA2_86098_c0_seq4.p1 gnl/MRDRNA2_/MRDRNA2_86098_c0~~gnl/MRDRNA2_/MRDRNA2_86098_c0_seq4.p1  ORF type:complete len:368 (-),score=78.93 gnl/MRDRNA2_/MRDRNA2_86098_c0_seq4:572-1675(-)